MYIIKQNVLKNNQWVLRRYGKKEFPTYEEARNYLRRMIRKVYPQQMWLYFSSNANISDFNFKVVRK